MQQTEQVSFLGIGVQKAATSWLHDMLSGHPDVVTSEPKELDFFTSHYDRGFAWYRSHFSDGPAPRGECSPSYFCSLSAPMRAHRYNPDLRLLCILRDPVRRAFSNHLHEIRKGHIPVETTFEEAVVDNPMYLEQGRYSYHLQRWIDVFGRERVLVLLAEDIAAGPLSAFRSVCQHIGVRDNVVPEGLHERRHQSVASRHPALQRLLRRGGDSVRAIGLGSRLEMLKRAPSVRRLLAMNKLDLRSSIPEMKEETVQRLSELFAPEAQYVAQLLGRPTLPWMCCREPGIAIDGSERRRIVGAR